MSDKRVGGRRECVLRDDGQRGKNNHPRQRIEHQELLAVSVVVRKMDVTVANCAECCDDEIEGIDEAPLAIKRHFKLLLLVDQP